MPPSQTRTNARHVFLVDPLDGTKDFLSGNGEYTVNIALLDGSDPVAGVVYAPALGTIYAGAVGEGARRAQMTNGVVGAWQDHRSDGADRKNCAPSPAVRTQAVRPRNISTRCARRTSCAIGSSLKFCLIAAGEADIYPRMGQTMEWDTAAGDAILRAAGGACWRIDGKPLRYNKRNAAGGILTS